jgi:gamma-glutamyltranspeptidase/glutathione hydrolase
MSISRNTEKNPFVTGRSVIMAKNGMVATSQPLACVAGIDILKQGGNAIDAAIAAAAVMNVVEPLATGIGGDLFMLIYLAKTRKLKGLNGTGRAPYKATRNYFIEKGFEAIPNRGMLSVSVPGTVDAWSEALEKYGTMSLSHVLEPAIEYAEKGFPVTEIIAKEWKENEELLKKFPDSAKTYLINGKAPCAGEIFIQKDLASTLKKIARDGKDAFYRGEIAEAIVRFSEKNGGLFTLRDFEDHTSTWVEPIKTDYRGYDIYELPSNTQGLTALMMLNLVEGFDLKSLKHNSARFFHILVEAKKLAFADRDKYIGDPDFAAIPEKWLLSKEYAKERREMIDPEKAGKGFEAGRVPSSRDTIYMTVADKDGNIVSYINSLFSKFGSGMTVGKTGICLQARASGFTLVDGHFNCIEPGKRPFHTNIPAMMFKDRKPYVCFGVMGADMQPQGHLQVVSNIIDFGMNVQQAVDAPRFRQTKGKKVCLETEIPEKVREKLMEMGHEIIPEEETGLGGFGGAQAIMIDRENGVLLGGSDYRKDGCAVGY